VNRVNLTKYICRLNPVYVLIKLQPLEKGWRFLGKDICKLRPGKEWSRWVRKKMLYGNEADNVFPGHPRILHFPHPNNTNNTNHILMILNSMPLLLLFNYMWKLMKAENPIMVS
jgi:hypothetical protein